MLPKSLKKLVFELGKLPTIGERSAYRIAYHLITKSEDEVGHLVEAISGAKKNLKWCSCCRGLSDDELCFFCSDTSRITDQLCIVERPADIFSLERSGAYHGLYHVLHGVWSPLKGIKPEHLTIDRLLSRMETQKENSIDPLTLPLREVIIATGTTVEGDATAMYLSSILDSEGLVISRLAQGLPKGGELEYADEVTIGMSFSGRKTL